MYGSGANATNVIALYVDATQSSSWWYAGGGLTGHVHLISTQRVHIAGDGLAAWSSNIDSITTGGRRARSADLHVRVDLQNDAKAAVSAGGAVVSAVVYAPDGAEVSTAKTLAPLLPASSSTSSAVVSVTVNVSLSDVLLWTIQQPALYTVVVVVSVDGAAVETLNTTAGIRLPVYDRDTGFSLNGERIYHKGFCDHENFGGVGAALHPRIHLFRAQMLRAVGGNARRFSHNAPPAGVLDFYDRLGVVSMPEHRNFINGSHYYDAWRAMVRRDRGHASVVFFSFCNENHCITDAGSEAAVHAAADAMRDIAHEESPWVALTANMLPRFNDVGDNVTLAIDIQGLSHQRDTIFIEYHTNMSAAVQSKPLVASECCSCESEMGAAFPSGSHHNVDQTSCAAEQTGWAMDLPFMIGTYVWTLMDYFGEGHVFPFKSSSYGQFSLCGWPKAMAYFYRAMWLSNAAQFDAAGRPNVPAPPLVHIAQPWDADSTEPARTITVAAGGVAAVRLLVNGRFVSATQSVPPGVAAVTFSNVSYDIGKIVAQGLDTHGAVVANHTVTTSHMAAASLVLSLDAPMPHTGTGYGRLLSDGEDVALVRATLVDSAGNPAHLDTRNITFHIVSGPGTIVGTDNGNATDLSPQTAASHVAHRGLVRCVVRSTQDAASPAWHRRRVLAIHPLAELVAAGVDIVEAGDEGRAATEIVLEATAPGLDTVRLTIPLSTDAATDGVLAVAQNMNTAPLVLQ